jgi:hypothetical protein
MPLSRERGFLSKLKIPGAGILFMIGAGLIQNWPVGSGAEFSILMALKT